MCIRDRYEVGRKTNHTAKQNKVDGRKRNSENGKRYHANRYACDKHGIERRLFKTFQHAHTGGKDEVHNAHLNSAERAGNEFQAQKLVKE